MWFKFPEGCSGIAVELQHFVPEAEDNKGRKYFRAPNHFAPRILAIKGFEAIEPPETTLGDLPQPDPLRDGAIAELTRGNEALKVELSGLRADLNAATAKIIALVNERAELEKEVEARDARISDLEEDLDEAPAKAPGKAK